LSYFPFVFGADEGLIFSSCCLALMALYKFLIVSGFCLVGIWSLLLSFQNVKLLSLFG